MKNCDFIDYFTPKDRDGLGPTEAILCKYAISFFSLQTRKSRKAKFNHPFPPDRHQRLVEDSDQISGDSHPDVNAALW